MIKLPDNLLSFPKYAKATMTDEDLRETLLSSDGWVMLAGRMWHIKSKPLGAGVNQVWLENDNAK